MPEDQSPPREVEVTISWATLLKIIVAGALVCATIKLAPLLGLLFLALLIAITLSPVANWVERKTGSPAVGVIVCALLVFGSVALFFLVVTPVVAAQISELIKTLPMVKENVLGRLPPSGPLHDAAAGMLQAPTFSDPEPMVATVFAWGTVALKSFIEFFIVLIVAIYLVADGQRVFQWLLAFLSPAHRRKVAAAAPEMAAVVFSYMAGQLITSLLCAGFVFGLLTVLKVPNALLLGVVAGIFDILPLIGFFLSLAPSVAMALTVSPTTAGIVVVLYTAYHLLENYFIVPKVYGDRLRLSTLTVLVACLAAGLVAGVVGVIAILPIIASYPIIERIWLRPLLEPDTVAKHTAIDEHEHPQT